MDQSDQSPNTQSRPPHSWSAHAFVSRVNPSHASPLCCASLRMRRMRVCLPTPHVLLQEVHSCQFEKTHGTGAGPLPHGSVSSRLPVHGSPPFSGGLRTVRWRKTWPVAFWHWLHSDQPERAQSTGFKRHSSGTCSTDSILEPAHGVPHSLFTMLMVLSRKRSPVQRPRESYHSPQSLNSQSTGVQSSQLGRSGQVPHISSNPWQVSPCKSAARTSQPVNNARQSTACEGILLIGAILSLWSAGGSQLCGEGS
mmetsp:Transcript_70987/g.196025  ORF Transcript_70987/g.196025 Transcript_70987/m.196025 type:complete len:253 (+) Transcript_70987:2234-2992(+)